MKKLLLLMLSLSVFTGCKTIEEDKEANIPQDEYQENMENREKPPARISLDWEGTYSGVLPCEDCTGIETYLTLREDSSFEMVQRSIATIGEESAENKTNGTFSWNEEGTAINLPALEGQLVLKVGDLYLVPLNEEGKEIPAEPGNNFHLLKQ